MLKLNIRMYNVISLHVGHRIYHINCSSFQRRGFCIRIVLKYIYNYHEITFIVDVLLLLYFSRSVAPMLHKNCIKSKNIPTNWLNRFEKSRSIKKMNPQIQMQKCNQIKLQGNFARFYLISFLDFTRYFVVILIIVVCISF